MPRWSASTSTRTTPPSRRAPKVKASAFYADPQARLDIADIKQQITWMKDQKLVDAAVDPNAVIDPASFRAI